MIGQEYTISFSAPEQNRSTLSLCETRPASLASWVKELPKTNVGETARLLYKMLNELNALHLSPSDRETYLDILREPVAYICKRLSSHFFGKSIVLAEKEQKVANLTLALHHMMADGYKIIIRENLEGPLNDRTKNLCARACHQVLNEYGYVLLNEYGSYANSTKNVWKELHNLYLFAESRGILDLKIPEAKLSNDTLSTVAMAYKRVVLMSCCSPNQLRPSELKIAFEAFEVWSSFVEIMDQEEGTPIFVVNMDGDQPPCYRSLIHTDSTEHYHFIDTSELVDRLTHCLTVIRTNAQEDLSGILVTQGLIEPLLSHFHKSFGILTKRTFKRIESDGSIALSIGLSAAHFHIANQTSFHSMMSATPLLSEGDENYYVNQSDKMSTDKWSEVYDASTLSTAAAGATPVAFNTVIDENEAQKFPTFDIPLVNTSPGGFCLQWEKDVASNLHAGELVAVKEKDSNNWSAAVVRWILNTRSQKGLLFGIELIAANCKPCGVKLLSKTGAPSQFLRGLIVPAIPALEQPKTLITTRLPFKSGSKVSIKCGDSDSRFSLGKLVTATSSFSQFQLEQNALDKLNNNIDKGADSDDFQSLWEQL